MRKLVQKMQHNLGNLSHITVLSSISTDVSQPIVYLTAKNGQKYLIGRIGEGFQRSSGETKTNTANLSGIFLTGQLKWKSVSGVPGLLLCLADRALGINKMYCGDGNILDRARRMIQSWQYFKFHQNVTVEPVSEVYSDKNVEISPLVLGDSASYVVKMKPTRGKFMAQKAKALGVPVGALFSELANGNSVTIPDTDRIVEPHEVLGPAPIPSTALVLDLPSMHHVEKAIETSTGFRDNSGGTSESKAVYYFFEKHIDLGSPLIQQLIDILGGSQIRHFISHPSTSPDYNTLTASSKFQDLFRSKFPDHFSKLYSQPARVPLKLPHAEAMQRSHLMSMEPRDVEPALKNKNKKQKVEDLPSPFSEDISEGLLYIPCTDLKEPEVFTLGTGASSPSKYRNVSSTLVRTRHGSVIFDCGEGTYNSLGRIFGREGRKSILREVKILYISHMHADHHLGATQTLFEMVQERKALFENGKTEEKLILAAPIHFHRFVETWAELDGFQNDLSKYVEQLDSEKVCFGLRYSATDFRSLDAVQKANERLASVVHGIHIETCTAIHCSYSYNCTVTLNGDGNMPFKMSYSGDTRPNKFFADTIGQGSQLLIHEATHENDLQKEAIKRNHSTIGEALKISERMKAANTVLTHISQRYPRLPTIGPEMESNNQYAYFGFDFMHTKLSEIKNVQQMIPQMSALLESLAGEENDME